MNITICEFMDETSVDNLRQRFDVTYDARLVDRPQDLARALAGADALVVRNRTQVNAALLAAAPQLRVVGRLGVGLDNIDVAECERRGERRDGARVHELGDDDAQTVRSRTACPGRRTP